MSGETEKEVSAWTIDSLRYHLEQIATDLDLRYEQRFIAQEKAVENALASRDKEIAAALAAQEKAVSAAFAAQEKAVAAALAAQEKQVEAARVSQDKAIDKAEAADQKRFDSVNEFRAQLSDQATTFLPRNEADVRIGSLAEKVEVLQARIDKGGARADGLETARTNTRLDMGVLIGGVGVAIALIAVVVSVVIASR